MIYSPDQMCIRRFSAKVGRSFPPRWKETVLALDAAGSFKTNANYNYTLTRYRVDKSI